MWPFKKRDEFSNLETDFRKLENFYKSILREATEKIGKAFGIMLDTRGDVNAMFKAAESVLYDNNPLVRKFISHYLHCRQQYGGHFLDIVRRTFAPCWKEDADKHNESIQRMIMCLAEGRLAALLMLTGKCPEMDLIYGYMSDVSRSDSISITPHKGNPKETEALLSLLSGMTMAVYLHRRTEYFGQVVELLNCGVDVNAKVGKNDMTPLMYTAQHGIKDITELLIEHGADVNAKGGKNDMTPLMYAVNYYAKIPHETWYRETIDVLIRHGADVNARDRNGNTALMLAVEGQTELRFDIVNLLIRHGANVNARNNNGKTVLMLAVLWSAYWKTIVALIKNSADVNAKDTNGNTALTWAKGEAYALLVEAGAQK